MSQISFTRTLGTVFFALTCIVFGDAAGKTLTAQGFSPFFVAWARFGLAALLLLPFSGLRWPELRFLLNWWVLLRAMLIVLAISCILTALRTEPMANVFGGFFIGPVVSYFLSALLLKEAISRMRTALLLLGFAGVLLVVKPGFGATPGMGFAVLSGCFHGAYLVITRWLAGTYRPRFLLISQLMVGGVVLMPLGLGGDVPGIDPWVLALISISAVGSAIGNYLLVIANRTTPASLIAPLIYTQLIAATVVGYVIFAEWPDPVSFVGLSIILASGLLSLWVGRRQPLASVEGQRH